MALSLDYLADLLNRYISDDEYSSYLLYHDKSDVPADISGRSIIIAKLYQDEYDSRNTEESKANTNHKSLNSIANINNIDKLIRIMNPKAYKKVAYVCLDSRYAEFLDNNTRLRFAYTNFISEFNNATSVIGNVKNIISVRMLSMTIRSFSSVADRAGIAIDEFNAQAIVLPNGRRFHFMGLLNDLSFPVPLTARNAKQVPIIPDVSIYRKYELLAGYKFNEGFYHFNKPITSINTLTVSISDPFSLVTIPKYEFMNVQVANVTATTVDLIFDGPHYYNDSDIFSMFIDEFTTTDPVSDAVLINWLNTQEHLLANVIDANTLQVDYHAANKAGQVATPIFAKVMPVMVIPPIGSPSTCRVRINSQRVIMNFEFHYMDDGQNEQYS